MGAKRIPGVHNQLGPLENGRIVELLVIGDDHHAVGLCRHRQRFLRSHLAVIELDHRYIRVAVGDARASAFEQQDDIERR